MIRISSLVVCASLLACAMSQTGTTTVPQPTTTVPQPTTTPTMPPTTQPPPPNDYILRENPESKPCLRMKANITAKFDYKNKTSGLPLSYNYTFVDARATVDKTLSKCPTKLVLSFDPPHDEGDVNLVTFTFMKTSDGKAWTSEMVQYNFTVTEEEFPDSEYIGMSLSYNSTNKLLDSNVELESSYMCKANEDIKFNSNDTEYNLNVTLEIIELQVQAYFNEPKDDEFGAVQECSADSSKGNKIVPIAVGAALAGLVIVVLIAYLIGRLKSRRQSSYEALS